ncbi:hypothetical protein HZA55_00565 [Candidatus Poribacteria bacterium]|nr:hypothetical protein [Candidatus Poribacteria bacterium]
MKILFVILILTSSVISAELEMPKSNDEAQINIKADNVEYVLKKDQEIGIFTGNVFIEQQEFKFYSDKVILYPNENKIIGEGNIKVISESPELKSILTGGKGEFHKNDNYAIVTDSPKLIVIEKNKDNIETIITGEQMEMFSNKNEMVVKKNVHILQNQIEAWSDVAVFHQKEKKLVLSVNAKVSQRKNVFSAEEILFFMEDNRIIMNKSVRGVVIPEKEKK